jgi:hypothetical protein
MIQYYSKCTRTQGRIGHLANARRVRAQMSRYGVCQKTETYLKRSWYNLNHFIRYNVSSFYIMESCVSFETRFEFITKSNYAKYLHHFFVTV